MITYNYPNKLFKSQICILVNMQVRECFMNLIDIRSKKKSEALRLHDITTA